MVFGSPYNWCDSRCDRCAAADECPLQRRIAGSRWRHEILEEDPDDADIVMRDVLESLRSALVMLKRVAEEEGVDLTDAVSEVSSPASLSAERLRRAGMEYVSAAHDLLGALPSDLSDRGEQLAEQVGGGSTLIAAKSARLAPGEAPSYSSSDDDVWRADGVPNLLLVEVVDRIVAEAVHGLAAMDPSLSFERYERVRKGWRRALAPWAAAVPHGALDELHSLISERRAPSPFLVMA